MVTRIYFIVICFAFLSCKKDLDNPKPCALERKYFFEISSSFYPEKRNYAIGDTIYFLSEIPKTLANIKKYPHQQIDYSTAVWIGTTIHFQRFNITGDNHYGHAMNNFTIFPIIGTLKDFESNYSQNDGKAMYFEKNLNLFTMKIGIICKQKGSFLFYANDGGSPGLRGQNCSNADMLMRVTNVNKNPDLFLANEGYAKDTSISVKAYHFEVN